MTNLMNSRPRGQSPSLPKWIKPQLCKLVDAPPQGPEWLHEIKYDGYRMHARLDRGEAQLLTRTGLDWTRKYPVIGAALSALPAIRRISMGSSAAFGRTGRPRSA
jgi:ATP-dependent DNA ligase